MCRCISHIHDNNKWENHWKTCALYTEENGNWHIKQTAHWKTKSTSGWIWAWWPRTSLNYLAIKVIWMLLLHYLIYVSHTRSFDITLLLDCSLWKFAVLKCLTISTVVHIFADGRQGVEGILQLFRDHQRAFRVGCGICRLLCSAVSLWVLAVPLMVQ